jgi:sulfatase modifying factor 1
MNTRLFEPVTARLSAVVVPAPFALLLAALFCASARAVTISIPTVPIGNPGNPADTQVMSDFTSGYGSVGYSYRIGQYEVTNAQYVEFLNGVDPTGANSLELYSTFMTSDARGGINFNGGAANGSKYEIKSGRDKNPVVFVSWYDSIRFANWLHNGQASGDTENGTYTLQGGTPTPSNGNSITRNPGAKWWLPSENEWYKAAYHKNDGATGNYWDYPTSTDAVPYSDQPAGSDAPDPSNTANFYKDDFIANGYDDGFALSGSTSSPTGNALTDAGAYALTTNPYGTFDQGGNVSEWNEALINGSSRGLRGGSWNFTFFAPAEALRASLRLGLIPPTGESSEIGFRVASIPEPATMCLGTMAVIGISWRKRRRGERLLPSPRAFQVARNSDPKELG